MGAHALHAEGPCFHFWLSPVQGSQTAQQCLQKLIPKMSVTENKSKQDKAAL